MKRYFSITSIGDDRPGIVAAVSEVIYKLGANIEDSSMTILKGQFAMILIVSMDDGLDKGGFRGLREALGLHITVEELDRAQLDEHVVPSGTPHIISAIGTDKPGIVYGLSKLLSSKGINITDMSTKVIPGEDTPVYTMVIEITVPAGIEIDKVEEELSELGRELSVDFSLREVEVLGL
ncbi:MAG: hypothetical protein IH874_05490 [Candidatus Dadabacteria bacterium]|nr:hypothetical protein [Candidatus Dadabacteria bacterium]